MRISPDLAKQSKAWPVQEAVALLDRVQKEIPHPGPLPKGEGDKGYVLFETGYGPSGLPHLGTFGEVVRTTMVRKAFEAISDIPTKLFAFSDDMDGLRKVPDNIPNKEMVVQHLGKPLTSIPDPFGTHENFGAHMNARLQAFLDAFNFEYTFKSSTQCYKEGLFDKILIRILHNYDEVINVILPTLGNERRETYSPFLPLCKKTGRVLQVPVVERKLDAGTIVYRNEDGSLVETPVTGGHCKLQWKCDWAMRWVALGVDYEMHGKDLLPSVELSAKVCKAIGGTPPQTFMYELFLDEKGEKISKSKGNGISLEQWLAYAPPESLSYYMYQNPRRAKKLYFDVIPQQVDDYLTFVEKYALEDEAKRIDNPAWHIHGGQVPPPESSLRFGMLLNLAGVANTDNKSVLWGFISRHMPGVTPQTHPFLDKLVGHAIRYYQDFVKITKRYRAPTDTERAALSELMTWLEGASDEASAEDIQNEVYEIGKRYPFKDLKDWFAAQYEVLLGMPKGPRIGTFIKLFGRTETVALIKKALAGELQQVA